MNIFTGDRPERIGNYRLLKRISTGSCSEVFLARREGGDSQENPVVIKRILPILLKYKDFVEVLLDEVRTAACLHHPNLVNIEAFGQADGEFFICMEYVDGVDLMRLVRLRKQGGQPMPPVIASLILSEVCAGLHYAHTFSNEEGRPLGLIHREVTPANILVTRQGAVKVLGLGFAQAEGKLRNTHAGILMGKVQFISPEQVRGKPLDFRSDIFHLGLVLFEALTNTRAFVRETELATLRALLEEPAPVPSAVAEGIPRALDEIVLKALQRDPLQRFSSANVMRQALDEFVASSTAASGVEVLRAFVAEGIT